MIRNNLKGQCNSCKHLECYGGNHCVDDCPVHTSDGCICCQEDGSKICPAFDPRPMTATEANNFGICDKCDGSFDYCEMYNDNQCCLTSEQIEVVIEEIK